MKEKNNSSLLLAAVFVVLGLLSRFIPAAPNFSPIISVALFSGVFFADKRIAFLIPIIVMFVSDMFIGFHSTMFATYLSFALIAIIGMKMTLNKKNVLLSSIGGAVLFFIVTNFAVWCLGWYGYTFAGLVTCFEAAIPFFRNTLASSLFYSIILFGGFYLVEKYLLKVAKAS